MTSSSIFSCIFISMCLCIFVFPLASPTQVKSLENQEVTSFREEASTHLKNNVNTMVKINENQENNKRADGSGACWPYSFDAEKNTKLGTCCWFGARSCCTAKFAPAIVPSIQRQLAHVRTNGTRGECYAAIADLLCLWCHPSTNSFLEGTLRRPELHICLSLCDKLWGACRSQQETFGISPPASTSRQFCAALLVEEESEDDGNDGGVNVIISQNNKNCYAGVDLLDVAASGCTGVARTDKNGEGMPTGLVVAMIVVPLLGVLAIATAIGLFAYHHKKKLEAEGDATFSIPADAFPTAEHLLGSGSDDDDDHKMSVN